MKPLLALAALASALVAIATLVYVRHGRVEAWDGPGWSRPWATGLWS